MGKAKPADNLAKCRAAFPGLDWSQYPDVAYGLFSAKFGKRGITICEYETGWRWGTGFNELFPAHYTPGMMPDTSKDSPTIEGALTGLRAAVQPVLDALRLP